MLAALDIETTGLCPWADRILGIGVYNKELGGRYFTDLPSFDRFLNQHPDLKFVMHNGSFDVNFLRRKGLDIRERWAYDTRTIASVIYPWPQTAKGQRSPFGLENLGIQWLGKQAYKLDRTDMSKYTTQQVADYCLEDCELTLNLYHYEIQTIAEQSQAQGLDFITNWIMPATKAAADMEYNGIDVDVVELSKFKKQMQARLEEVCDELNKATAHHRADYKAIIVRAKIKDYEDRKRSYLSKHPNTSLEKVTARYQKLAQASIEKIKEFNFSSPSQLLWLLKREGLEPVDPLTGKESTGTAVLKSLAEKGNKIVESLLEFRKIEKLLNANIPNLLDNIKPDGRVHGRLNVAGTRTGRLSSSGPNCLSLDTEILTRGGFKQYNTLTAADLIATYNPKTKLIEWEPYLNKYISPLRHHNMVEIIGKHINFKMTDNHRCYVQTARGVYKTIPASKINYGMKITNAALDPAGEDYNKDKLRLAVAIQADAHLPKNRPGLTVFELLKTRKVERLVSLLHSLDISFNKYTRKNKYTYISFSTPSWLPDLLDEEKKWRWNLLNFNVKTKKIFIRELNHWDGYHQSPHLEYWTKHAQNADVVLAVCTTINIRAHVSKDKKQIYRIRASNNFQSHISKPTFLKRNITNLLERVWCVKVSTGYFIARRGPSTFITGNCQQITKGKLRECIVARDDKHVLFAGDYSQLEVRVIAELSKELKLVEAFKQGIDPYSVFAKEMFSLDIDPRRIKEEMPAYRDAGKVGVLSILYRTGAKKLRVSMQKSLGRSVGLKECQQYIDNFKSGLKQLGEFDTWLSYELANQKIFYNLLGRPFMIESNEDIYMKGLNTLVQGSASDLVVYSQTDLVLPELRKRNIWHETKLWVHDEVIIELKKDEADQVAQEIIQPLMTFKLQEKLELDVPLKLSYTCSRSWEKS